MNYEEAHVRAHVLKALASPARLIIVDELKRGDRCSCDLQPLLNLDQSVLSRHLAQLQNAGIITSRKEGVKVIHHLECRCILQALDCTIGVIKSQAQRAKRLVGSIAV